MEYFDFGEQEGAAEQSDCQVISGEKGGYGGWQVTLLAVLFFLSSCLSCMQILIFVFDFTLVRFFTFNQRVETVTSETLGRLSAYIFLLLRFCFPISPAVCVCFSVLSFFSSFLLNEH